MWISKYREYIAGLMIIGILLLAVAHSDSRQFLNSNSGAISGLLSGLLVLLYLAQYKTQKEQQTLMEANHETVVDVENRRADNEKLVVELSNFGNGVATDLELVVLPLFEQQDNLSPEIGRYRLTRQPEDPDQTRLSQSINAGESKVPFEARPAFALRHGSNSVQGYGIMTGIDELEREGIGVFRLYFYVRYKDLLGNHQLDPLIILEADFENRYRVFEEFYKGSGKVPVGTPLAGQPEISAEDLEFDLSEVDVPKERTVI